MIPLTAELLAKRLIVLSYRAEQTAGPVEDVLWHSLICDGCRRVVRTDREPFPRDWMTSGDVVGGFRDYCPECLQ
jgi:hypothetical protein